jgi:multiple antibiotic resistance protein
MFMELFLGSGSLRGDGVISLDMYGPANTALHELQNSTYVRFSLLAFSSIFFLVDPFAAIGSFLSITSGADPQRRKRMAFKAALTCFIVLTSFAIAGQFIFSLFGIKLPAFEIAGGLILLLIGIDMLEAKRSPTQESSDETIEGASKEDAGIVPLGIPMLAGPGAISSVMVLVGQAPNKWQMSAVFLAIAITAVASYGVLSGADKLRRVLGETGIRILVRIMGLLLVALAVQFFVNGLTDLGVIGRQ